MQLLWLIWLAATLSLVTWRLVSGAERLDSLRAALPTLLGYSLVILAPMLGYWIAQRLSLDRALRVQPTYRFARFGNWRLLSRKRARARSGYGPVGFIASLLIGMLLNVALRAVEFLTIVPVMGPDAPQWGQAMFTWMAANVIVGGFFYMVVFGMALRTMPLFPRTLLFAWMVDILMQLAIARQVGAIEGIPPDVAAGLAALLDGNVKKVLISAAVWAPYLLLSERVNLTYRHRTGQYHGLSGERVNRLAAAPDLVMKVRPSGTTG